MFDQSGRIWENQKLHLRLISLGLNQEIELREFGCWGLTEKHSHWQKIEILIAALKREIC